MNHKQGRQKWLAKIDKASGSVWNFTWSAQESWYRMQEKCWLKQEGPLPCCCASELVLLEHFPSMNADEKMQLFGGTQKKQWVLVDKLGRFPCGKGLPFIIFFFFNQVFMLLFMQLKEGFSVGKCCFRQKRVVLQFCHRDN